MGRKKRIGIGFEFYKEFIDKSLYYVDKTLLIRDLFEKGGKVNLFTRPRRFGKTLALTMLKTFFEMEFNRDGNVVDNSRYFDGMKIMDAGEEYTRHMGKHPVIFLTLKSARQPSFDMAYKVLVYDIATEFDRHKYVLDGDCLAEMERDLYRRLMNREADMEEYAMSLKFLSTCLYKYHGRNSIILLDEYDVPLENSWFQGFYDQMVQFIRSFFESSLKTNDHLELAVVTGCLRISKESIFTGLNNLAVNSILTRDFAEYYGFTQPEVEEVLAYFELEGKNEEVKEWYDGYLFGQTEVYNPWSITNYVKEAVSYYDAFPRPYWSNTSSNSIVRELVEGADADVKKEIEGLMAGGTIEKAIHEDITYGEIHKSQDNLWNFLFFTGYLKAVSQRFEEETTYLTMTVPNAEIRYIYRNTIYEWFNQKVKQADFTPFYEALLTGNCEGMEQFISRQLAESISYFDSSESFYHGYMVGIMGSLEGYGVDSNKEHGNGRPDLVLSPFTPKETAIIIELKRADKFSQMDALCDAALAQIEEENYAAELLDFGYQKILKYGICFCKKTCMIKKAVC